MKYDRPSSLDCSSAATTALRPEAWPDGVRNRLIAEPCSECPSSSTRWLDHTDKLPSSLGLSDSPSSIVATMVSGVSTHYYCWVGHTFEPLINTPYEWQYWTASIPLPVQTTLGSSQAGSRHDPLWSSTVCTKAIFCPLDMRVSQVLSIDLSTGNTTILNGWMGRQMGAGWEQR